MTQENEAIKNNTFVNVLMEQQANNFYVEMDDSGEQVYHWIDTRVDMLSSSKLWSILRQCEASDRYMDLAFTDAITNELINRQDCGRSPVLRMQ
ncbi:MAG: hypothetical protein QNK31_01615 [Porticoccus sp.]|nr:hypothetical protein [Porticoccus sp.]